MKNKLANIRSELAKLTKDPAILDAINASAEDLDVNDHLEAIYEILESLEPLVEHLDDFDDFDTESWTEELRQMIAELDD